MLTPYEGQEPYIFISYAHKNVEAVLPIIEELAGRGYRVWYDKGIEPGTEWPDYIAQHIMASSLVVAFISAAADASPNCRREINFSIAENKPMLAIHLEDIKLSPGLAMQLGTLQAMFWTRNPNVTSFVDELIKSSLLAPCRIDADEITEIKDDLPLSHSAFDDTEEEKGYRRAITVMEQAIGSNDYVKAAALFGSLKAYKDALEKRKLCLVNAQKASEYEANVKSLLSAKTVAEFEKLFDYFSKHTDYLDCAALAEQASDNKNALLYRRAEELLENAANKASFIKAADLFASLGDYRDAAPRRLACMAEADRLVEYEGVIRMLTAAREATDYDAPIAYLTEHQGYRDCTALLSKAKEAKNRLLAERSEANKAIAYKKAVTAMENAVTYQELIAAASLFKALGNYPNASEKEALCFKRAHYAKDYEDAVKVLQAAKTVTDYQKILRYFRSFSGYRDADALLTQGERAMQALLDEDKKKQQQQDEKRIYEEACRLMNAATAEDDLLRAIKLFASIPNHPLSAEKIDQCNQLSYRFEQNRFAAEEETRKANALQEANAAMNAAKTQEDYHKAALLFEALGNYQDAPLKKKACTDTAQEMNQKAKKAFQALLQRCSAKTQGDLIHQEQDFTKLPEYQTCLSYGSLQQKAAWKELHKQWEARQNERQNQAMTNTSRKYLVGYWMLFLPIALLGVLAPLTLGFPVTVFFWIHLGVIYLMSLFHIWLNSSKINSRKAFFAPNLGLLFQILLASVTAFAVTAYPGGAFPFFLNALAMLSNIWCTFLMIGSQPRCRQIFSPMIPLINYIFFLALAEAGVSVNALVIMLMITTVISEFFLIACTDAKYSLWRPFGIAALHALFCLVNYILLTTVLSVSVVYQIIACIAAFVVSIIQMAIILKD